MFLNSLEHCQHFMFDIKLGIDLASLMQCAYLWWLMTCLEIWKIVIDIIFSGCFLVMEAQWESIEVSFIFNSKIILPKSVFSILGFFWRVWGWYLAALKVFILILCLGITPCGLWDNFGCKDGIHVNCVWGKCIPLYYK